MYFFKRLMVLFCLHAFASASLGSVLHSLQTEHPLIKKVKAYQEARKRGDEAVTRDFFSEDSRIWFEKKEGPGRVRNKDGSGPWADWDKFFNAQSTYQDYRVEGSAVSVLAIETNDFYRLIDRPPSPVRLTYYFNAEGRVEGMLVASAKKDDASKDRFDEFKEWAKSKWPREMKYLMPDGEIVPDIERAKLWRKLLSEWRAETRLPPVK